MSKEETKSGKNMTLQHKYIKEIIESDETDLEKFHRLLNYKKSDLVDVLIDAQWLHSDEQVRANVTPKSELEDELRPFREFKASLTQGEQKERDV